MERKIPNCKKFTGYKPCYPDYDCWTNGCRDGEKEGFGAMILIVNLDAMGDVVMTTAQLPALKRKFPNSTIYWITLKIAAGVLENIPLIDKVFEYSAESLSVLKEMKFDYVMNVDKSQRSGAVLTSVEAKHKLGFGINERGQIIPVNKGAEYNYLLGMDDNLKFKLNTKTGQEYLAETFELDYRKDEYIFNFSEEELKFIDAYKKEIGITAEDNIIGFNTGCSNTFPNKKMTLEQHAVLIEKFLSYDKFKILLVGGPEDEERNAALEERFKGKIINTPVNEGIRRGACYESIPDVIITGDSFGMHLAIALKKYVIVWFGLSCWQEIELYGRGVKLIPAGLDCAPCWKKECPYDLECVQMIDLERIEKETLRYFDEIKKNI